MINKKILPRGISDFKKLLEEGYYYIDKTLLINEIEMSGDDVVLITRPRRFGKTLNLSMLKYFYESAPEKNDHLFHETIIWKNQKYRDLQAQYPVIFLSFKDIKAEDWHETRELFAIALSQEFHRHFHIYENGNLKPHQKNVFINILNKTASDAELKTSLRFLSEVLYEHYQQRVIVLIDEYDTPIVAAYYHHYYKELMNFMRILLPNVLKDNVYLKRGVITGIIRAAKEDDDLLIFYQLFG